MKDNKELVIPEAAKHDPESLEVLRVWIARGGQHISIQTGVWSDPAAWGILLADLARHVAASYQQEMGLDGIKVLSRIRAGLQAELDSPTDVPSGRVT